MENVVIIMLVLIIVGLAVFYIVREKKKGSNCIGCPYSKECGGKCRNNKERTE